jgi:hypothetical protein
MLSLSLLPVLCSLFIFYRLVQVEEPSAFPTVRVRPSALKVHVPLIHLVPVATLGLDVLDVKTTH